MQIDSILSLIQTRSFEADTIRQATSLLNTLVLLKKKIFNCEVGIGSNEKLSQF